MNSLIGKAFDCNDNCAVLNELLERKIVTMKEIIDFVILFDSVSYIIKFSQYVKNIDMKLLEEKLIATDDVLKICNFVPYFKFKNIKTLEDIVVKNHYSCKSIITFARCVENANIKRLEDIIINEGTPNDLLRWVELVKNADKKRIEKEIINSGDIVFMGLYVNKIKNADIDLITDTVIKTDNASSIDLFALLCRYNIDVTLDEKLFNKFIEIANYKELINSHFIKRGNGEHNLRIIDKILKISTPEEVYDIAVKHSESLITFFDEELEKIAKYFVDYTVNTQDDTYINLIIENGSEILIKYISGHIKTIGFKNKKYVKKKNKKK